MALHERGITDIVADLGDQIGHLFRTELRLVEAEAEQKVKKVTTAVVPLVAGTVVALSAIVILLMAAAAFLVERGLAASLSHAIVAVVAALGGYVLIRSGTAQLARIDLQPKRAFGQIQADVDLAKDQVS
jgi:hypothetical protein